MSSRLPLLLIPALSCDVTLWEKQINGLKDIADFSVADTTHHTDILSIAHDVLRHAPDRFALAGLSMGGYVALEVMRQAPERVLKLAIFNSTARPDTLDQQERRRLLLSMSRSGKFKGVTPRLLPLLVHPARLEDEVLTHLVTSMAERVGQKAFQNQQTAILQRIDSRPFLKDISCPSLVVAGRQDHVSPMEVMQEIAEGIAGARFEIIEHCGHLSPLEHPQTVNRLMREWLVG